VHGGERVPTKPLPDWVIRVGARFNSTLAEMAKELGTNKRTSNEKARRLLGWEPRTSDVALLETVESLVRLGLVKPLNAR
jgi:dihydroflavonol-4-reductase